MLHNTEFSSNIYYENPHLMWIEFDILTNAIEMALSDGVLARRVLRPEDVAEWQRYTDHQFPATRNGCALGTQLLAGLLVDRGLIAYGETTFIDPISHTEQTGEHYRNYVSIVPDQIFTGFDVGNKTDPLPAELKPEHIVPLDTTFNQFTDGAVFELRRLRTRDQFYYPQHDDLHRRSEIFEEYLRGMLHDYPYAGSSLIRAWLES